MRTFQRGGRAGGRRVVVRTDGTALTMTVRTPGDDLELAAGFLRSEAVIRPPADIAEIKLSDGDRLRPCRP